MTRCPLPVARWPIRGDESTSATSPISSSGASLPGITASSGYSGTPLPRKLGVREDSRVLVVAAPAGFTLDAEHHLRARGGSYDVQLVFCPDTAALLRRWPAAAQRTAPRGALWVAWPKRASGVPTDLSEDGVRAHALPLGWVDVKVCAVDKVWSGLKLVRRLAARPGP